MAAILSGHLPNMLNCEFMTWAELEGSLVFVLEAAYIYLLASPAWA